MNLSAPESTSMKTPFARGMSRATELTRAGRLDEATALIRSLLSDRSAPDTAVAADDVIEGTFTRLDESARREPDPTARQNATVDAAPRKARGSKAGKRLGATLRDIARGGMRLRDGRPAVNVDVPPGAQFLSQTHAGVHGARDYRLYVPARQPDGPMPLIVMLHGCTQSPEDFAVATGMNDLAEDAGCLVAWPEQPLSANANKCWNWFRPQDQEQDGGEPAMIAGIVRDVLRAQRADPTRVYVAGLSAGGAAAAIMGAAYPELVAAVGVHSGLPVGGAQDMATAFAAMRSGATGKGRPIAAPTIVFHGLSDSTVHPANGAAVVAQALQARPAHLQGSEAGVSSGGRKYQVTRHEDAEGRSIAEHWQIEGAGHAWSGGRAGGSYTDPAGPDASREMLRFFRQHVLR
jgi:poly(hydroxyalkanoate) depolymerase family esterase